MQYTISCPRCDLHSYEEFTVEVIPNNEGVYDVRCPKNHRFKVDILCHHFQTLFENGLAALSDGYFIETILCFTASLERFQEYFIEIISIANKINPAKYELTWKLVSRQSERQLGAFAFTYLCEFKTEPILLDQKCVELRNNVVHKGLFPDLNQCIYYGDMVLNNIRPVIALLKGGEKYHIELIKSINKSGNFGNQQVTFHCIPYQIFAINRPINATDKKSVQDFLTERTE